MSRASGPPVADASRPGRDEAPGAPAHRARLPAALLEEIAGAVGTPAYVYDARALDAGARRWTAAVPSPDRIWYSVKANASPAVLARLADRGVGFEVATPGEHAGVLAAGVGRERILVGGVPKRAEDVADALRSGADLVVLQAWHEVEAAAAHADPGASVAVGLRVRPGIRAGAHPALQTGVARAKFGLGPERALDAWRLLSEVGGLRPRALGVHLGSGVHDTGSYLEALDLLLELAGRAGSVGAAVEVLDMGGGLAVDYAGGRDPQPAELTARLERRLDARDRSPGGAGTGLELRYEPGRSIVAPMGVLLTRVLYRREREGAPALVCDAAFTDFPRRVLYGAEHRIVPPGGALEGPPSVDVLGATCESGDVLGTGRALHGVGPGELLAVLDAGAYGFVMASNYNGRPRPPEVMVEDGRWRVIRSREPLEALWRGCRG